MRNRAKRRLRAVFLRFEKKIIVGNYIFITKKNILTNDFKSIINDLRFALKKMELRR